MTKQFKSKPLPYTMGNAGDLIKHGLLCELINWLSEKQQEYITFYDPFGGRPWQKPINNKVTERLENLQPCPLKASQTDIKNRYFGSGHLIKNVSEIYHSTIDIYTSDRDKDAQNDLKLTGLNLIELDEFNPDSAYSILDCQKIKEINSIILIDPFYDLQHINDVILTKIINLVSEHPIAVILYVLYKDEEIDLWLDFQQINNEITSSNVHYYSLSCEPITNSSIIGEGKFHSSVSLYLNKSFSDYKTSELASSLKRFSENLQAVISTEVKYTYQSVD